ncbi:MAG: hypothetical protein AAFP84_13550 [Actinomycetota bacterium]
MDVPPTPNRSPVTPDDPDGERPLSALPPVGVRLGAFAAVCLSGLAGAVIGYSLVSLQCDGDCAVPLGIGILVGALIASIGMAIVAVLVMRALGEWREVEDRERAGHAPTDPF